MQPRPVDARHLDLRRGDCPIQGFTLVRRRGRGGFGEVWEAEASGGIFVALKFVRLSGKAKAAELRALDFIRGIHHPNLLSNFGSWLIDDLLVMGMELADRSLWDRQVEATRQGLRGIPRNELLGYMSEVAAGIGHLNEYRHTLDGRTGFGIQHRDLKPPNILLFGGGAKVADLGLARAMEGEVSGHTGIWTFSYAPPEFFRGETARQSDQYSLAATYCLLRGGRLPFQGNAASVTAGHLFGRPDLEALPEPERPIVERALAKAPGDRWPDCRSFVEALRMIPAETVADILLDPDGPQEISEGALSSIAPPLLSSNPSRDDGADPGPRRRDRVRDLGFTSSSDPILSTPLASFPPASSEGVHRAHDEIPTLVLSSTPEEAGLSRPPSSPARSTARRRFATSTVVSAAAVLSALLAASSGIGPHETGRASGSPPPRASSSDALLGQGIGAAAEAEFAEPGRTPSPPLPGSALVVAPSPRPSAEPSTLASPRPSTSPAAPIPSSGPVLEGPIVIEDPARALDLAPVTAPAPPPSPGPGVFAPGTIASESLPDLVALPPRPELPPPPTTAPVRPGATAEPLAAALGRANQSLHDGNFARAMVDFDAVLRLDPDHASARLSKGIARHRSGDVGGALGDYSEAIRLRPDQALGYLSRGQAYHDMEAYHRAINDFDEAIRRRTDDPDAFLRRGLARYRSGDYPGSIVDLSEAIRLDPRNDRAAAFLADSRARVASSFAPTLAEGKTPTRAPGGFVKAGEPVPAAPIPFDESSRETGGPPTTPTARLAAGKNPAPPRETILIVPRRSPPKAEFNRPGGAQRRESSAAESAPNPSRQDRPRPLLKRILTWPFGR